jgi:hypothetical protein
MVEDRSGLAGSGSAWTETSASCDANDPEEISADRVGRFSALEFPELGC